MSGFTSRAHDCEICRYNGRQPRPWPTSRLSILGSWLQSRSWFPETPHRWTKRGLDLISPRRRKCDVFACDLGDPASVQNLVAEISAKAAQINVIVNNAAIQGPIGPLEQNDLGDWEQTIRVNLAQSGCDMQRAASADGERSGRFHPQSFGRRGDWSARQFYGLRQREGGARSVQRDTSGGSEGARA